MPQIRVFLSDDNQPIHELGEETVTVGRLGDNTIQIEDGSVSSHHAEIIFEAGGYVLRDKGSTNGTFLNGAPVTESPLNDGDQVRFGSIETIFAADVVAADARPLPQSERASVKLGSSSARPANFVNASPFPKPKEKTDPLTLAATAVAAIGGLVALAAVALSMGLSAPV